MGKKIGTGSSSKAGHPPNKRGSVRFRGRPRRSRTPAYDGKPDSVVDDAAEEESDKDAEQASNYDSEENSPEYQKDVKIDVPVAMWVR